VGIDDPTQTAPAPTSGSSAELHPLIWIVHHPDPQWTGRYRPLEGGADLTIGRATSGVFGGAWRDDDQASRRHVSVRRHGAEIHVEDLDSRNGSWLNAARIGRATWIDGQCLRVGSVVLLLRWSALPTGLAFEDREWVGVGPAHAALIDAVNTVGPLEYTVLIQGETGVGKDCVARAIHRRSVRDGPMVAINCAGVGDSVLQSELFGHTRGAFTGADAARAGLVDAARGGTLFLDEIGDASSGLQAALLRLLENGEYRPVGSDRVRRANVRVVAATHRDLRSLAAEGQFREDLLGRLDRWSLQVDPLRHRPEDIGVLVQHFSRSRPATAALLEQLVRYRWPGNVRELGATVERLCATTPAGEPLDIAPWLSAEEAPTIRKKSVKKRRKRASREELETLLEAHEGNIKACAAELEIGRNTLYAWLSAAGIEPGSYREA